MWMPQWEASAPSATALQGFQPRNLTETRYPGAAPGSCWAGFGLKNAGGEFSGEQGRSTEGHGILLSATATCCRQQCLIVAPGVRREEPPAAPSVYSRRRTHSG